MRLKGKKIILGVTGSIAAYKSALLLRLLVKEGAEVKVVITPAGKEFITPVTLSALSGNPVMSRFFGSDDGTWYSHVDLGIWADAFLIAPATACTLGKMASGIADNLLTATYLSAKCPVFIAPAMDLDMFRHPSTQKNISTLKEFGCRIIDPGEGYLASGLEGKGRMQDPLEITDLLIDFFIPDTNLQDKKFLITAGPTYEKIDPVRFIGNYSSGKMGYAIAEKLAQQGAEVILISGPVGVSTREKGITVVRVESAGEMLDACLHYFPQCDGAVMTAAVADFTPLNPENNKTKRGKSNWELQLKPTTDIAATLGKLKKKKQLLVGFALETNNELVNAQKKREMKNLDFIVLNSLKDEGAGFEGETNKITIIDRDNNQQAFELKSKKEVAADIVEKMISFLD